MWIRTCIIMRVFALVLAYYVTFCPLGDVALGHGVGQRRHGDLLDLICDQTTMRDINEYATMAGLGNGSAGKGA